MAVSEVEEAKERIQVEETHQNTATQLVSPEINTYFRVETRR